MLRRGGEAGATSGYAIANPPSCGRWRRSGAFRRRAVRARDRRRSGARDGGAVRRAGGAARRRRCARPKGSARAGRRSASRRGASTARSSNSCTARTTASSRIRSRCLRGAMRAALADGWGGSMIATDVQDVLFGGAAGDPLAGQPGRARGAPGQHPRARPRADAVRDDRATPAATPSCSRWRAAAGAEGINVAGICCTANEILMRQGMPVAGNYLHQELALLTGAVDLMVVDVQCVMPSLPHVAACHHTKIVTTSAKAHIPGAERDRVRAGQRARTVARDIVRRAIEAFARRDPVARARSRSEQADLVAGFTNENLPHYLGGRFRSGYRPLIDADRRRPGARRRRRRRLQHAEGRPGPASPGAGAAPDRRGRARRADRVQRHRLGQGRPAPARGGARVRRAGPARGLRGGRHPAGAAPRVAASTTRASSRCAWRSSRRAASAPTSRSCRSPRRRRRR